MSFDFTRLTAAVSGVRKSVRAIIGVIFVRGNGQATLLPAPVEVVVQKAKPTTEDRDGSDVESTGRWYFRGQILDNLDKYFRHIKCVKKFDRDAYDLFTRVGAVVTPCKWSVESELLSRWKDGRQRFGFGAIAPLMDMDDDGKLYPHFVYFMKLDRPPAHVQRVETDVYAVTAFYTDGVISHPLRFHVGVSADGLVSVLKEKHTVLRKVVPRTRRHGKSAPFAVPMTRWSIPERLCVQSKDKNKSPEELGRFIFIWAVNLYDQASWDVRIAAKKSGLTAAFCVDLLRVPYFFRDRDTTALTPTGQKKRVFHIVRTHERMSRGKRTSVKSHCRGLREFHWAGHDITVTMPGLHGKDILDVDFGVHDVAERDVDWRETVGMKTVGKGVSAAIGLYQ